MIYPPDEIKNKQIWAAPMKQTLVEQKHAGTNECEIIWEMKRIIKHL